MVIDFKDVTFSFREKKKKRTVRRIRLALLFLVFLTAVLLVVNYLDLKKVKRIEGLLLAKQVSAAEAMLGETDSSIFHSHSKMELKGLLHFYKGELEAAKDVFAKLPARKSEVVFSRFLQSLADEARYRELDLYLQYLIRRKEEVTLYQAICRSARFDPKSSDKILADFVPAGEDEAKTAKLLRSTNQVLQKNRYDCLIGINGEPLAYYDLVEKKTVSLVPGITFDEFTPFLTDGLKYYKLTLDASLQKQIHRLFDRYHGSFLLMDLSDNSILVAYSKPVSSQVKNAAFSQLYEPGSVVKVLTLFSYFDHAMPDLFPLTCVGNMTVRGAAGKRIFYDWIRHNRVNTYIDALTVSCNIALARMGLQLGEKKLSATLKQFYFNHTGFQDLFLHFRTGLHTTGPMNEWQLANLSVGLEEIKTTTFHLALVSAAIGQNGTFYSPYLIKNIKNVLQLGFYNHSAKVISVSQKDSTHYIKLKEAMSQVVADRRGTGYRGKVDFLQVAAKTGTAGNKKDGFDAVLMGFFPARQARYSFAFRLERGGKAQVEGAAFLKKFISTCFKTKK